MNLSDDVLLGFWRSVQGPQAGLTGPLIRFAGLVAQAALSVKVCQHCGEAIRHGSSGWIDRETHHYCRNTSRKHAPLEPAWQPDDERLHERLVALLDEELCCLARDKESGRLDWVAETEANVAALKRAMELWPNYPAPVKETANNFTGPDPR